MSAPGVTAEQKRLILEAIRRWFPEVRVRAFGSRVRGDHKAHSDLDLCLDGDEPLDLTQLAYLREALEKSPLPFPVDLLDGRRVAPEFRQAIENEGQEWVGDSES